MHAVRRARTAPLWLAAVLAGAAFSAAGALPPEPGQAASAIAAPSSFVVTVSAASAPASPPPASSDVTKTLLTLLATSLLGVVAAYATTVLKLRQDRGADREKDREHVRLQVLNPLLIAAEDLLDRIVDLSRRRKVPAKRDEMIRWFSEAKELSRRDPPRFALWCNDEGYFALSTLYVTAIYFHHAGTIRRDFPFFDLAADGESTLLAQLSEIRLAIGGKFGIWETLQDSLGSYAATAGVVKNYREFCEMFGDEKQAPWLNRLLDFFRDIHLKRDEQIDNTAQSLDALIGFLRTNLGLRAVGYVLGDAAFLRLHDRGLPAPLVERLLPLRDRRFQDEVHIVAAVVEAIGQDDADDYKPTILHCADKLRGWAR